MFSGKVASFQANTSKFELIGPSSLWSLKIGPVARLKTTPYSVEVQPASGQHASFTMSVLAPESQVGVEVCASHPSRFCDSDGRVCVESLADPHSEPSLLDLKSISNWTSWPTVEELELVTVRLKAEVTNFSLSLVMERWEFPSFDWEYSGSTWFRSMEIRRDGLQVSGQVSLDIELRVAAVGNEVPFRVSEIGTGYVTLAAETGDSITFVPGSSVQKHLRVRSISSEE